MELLNHRGRDRLEMKLLRYSSVSSTKNHVLFLPDNLCIVKIGDPLPGYGGTNRRVFADNIFALTYGDAKQRSKLSQHKVEVYQGELLRQTASPKPGQKWV